MFKVVSLICLCIFPFSAFSCDLTVRFEKYGLQAQNDPELGWHGLDVDFAKALLDKAGCTYRFVSAPWGRALKMLEDGELDLVLSVSDSPERREFAYFIGPQRMETIVFAQHRNASVTLRELNDLFHLRKPVAIQQGAFYGLPFSDALNRMSDPEPQFLFVADNKLKISLLQNQRISGFLEEKFNLIYQIENNPDFVDVEVHPFIVNREPVYYAFSKASLSQGDLKRLEAAYQSLQQSGELNGILKKYKLN
ncbi:ABC-type amino acid transport/signal transduction systems, periplasmic component/domain [Pseudoalteromonas luteoviolacea B = ATCC 29581]|nr:ABC-type amino acid transport/signal transduction systems, periplasmic component/domain [Pseudoalteromonas luteoviolacea B = ATCC 29581]